MPITTTAHHQPYTTPRGTASIAFLSVIAYAFIVLFTITTAQETQFIYNGFKGAINNLRLDGLAQIHKNGLLQLTDFTQRKTSHSFYSKPVIFGRNHLSFSTCFVFAMHPQIVNHSGHGIVFVISPSMNLRYTGLAQEYLGLFNSSNNGKPSNHVFGVEFDSQQNAVFKDINDNHVGIDVNSLISADPVPVSYYSDKERVWKTLRLSSGRPMQAWIDYDGVEMSINVTVGPIDESKPSKTLLSKHLDLSPILLDSMYIGFSSATGLVSNSHYLLGWSWNQSGRAQDLDLSKLPSLPKFKSHWSRLNQVIVSVLLSVTSLAVLLIGGVAWVIRRKRYAELEESWEQVYAPHRFSYKDLFTATRGFRDSELLGVGGFGKVYKGVLPSTGVLVAVKRVSHDSRQGMKEFVAEVASMRRLTHRNLVPLLGYCRRKGELLLVYEYMLHGSLDKFLFTRDEKSSKLCWSQRLKIIKGVASALLYLHEEWEQVVLHRDIKASNVLLDAGMNARLGDFGLARLYDHNSDPRTTHLVGTIGYIAPEANRTRVPSTRTDVFAFGMLLFEVGCGRRPIDPQADTPEDVILVDRVYNCWKKGAILEASDPKLEGDYVKEEMELVLRLGLLCSNPKPQERPTMRQVVKYLNHNPLLPEIPSDYNPEGSDFLVEGWGASSSLPSSSFPPSSSETMSIACASSTNSVLQSGR
ncbi:L-type lectin-domain containing receptor kinase IV.1-like [Silene latifolia]|uniref:L-type lectin-domain containing receptor kinase IV.1-like n=1 Tax=Silene latifolia TaxID=37657 RepID=UPI003D7847E5